MGWKDMLNDTGEFVLPWVGHRFVGLGVRRWNLSPQDIPVEHGWYRFLMQGRSTCSRGEKTRPDPTILNWETKGYLVGDRVVPDGVSRSENIHLFSERVHLLEEGLDRFVRVCAGRSYESGPLVFKHVEMPLGPEDDVHGAFFNQASSVDRIKNVSPALDAAFRLESYQRAQAEKRRLVLEQRRKEEEALLELEERRNILVRKLGDGEGRRELARLDFDTAARAALAVGGAEFLDSRKIRSNRNGTGEWAVKYRLDGRRFECVCDETLHLIDAGICLTSNETGEKGDTFFTLESIPSVIREAIADDKLVVYRHV